MRGIFSPHVIKKIMTGGVSLSQITFLGYQNVLWHYHDIVTTRHYAMRHVMINIAIRPISRHIAMMTFWQKHWFSPSFSIVLSQCLNVMKCRKLIQSNHNIAITLQLRCDYIMKCHDEIPTSWYVTTCVAIWKKLKKPNLIIINWVFSWF